MGHVQNRTSGKGCKICTRAEKEFQSVFVPAASSGINRLPTEVLAKIFSGLPLDKGKVALQVRSFSQLSMLL